MSAFIITAEQMAINCNVIAGAIGYSPVFNHWVVQVKDSLVIEKELSESKKNAEAKQAEIEVECLSQEKVAKRAEKKANSDPRIIQHWQPYFQNIE